MQNTEQRLIVMKSFHLVNNLISLNSCIYVHKEGFYMVAE